MDRRRGAPGERRGEVTPPYGCNTGSAQQRADVGIGPYGWLQRVAEIIQAGILAEAIGPYGWLQRVAATSRAAL